MEVCEVTALPDLDIEAAYSLLCYVLLSFVMGSKATMVESSCNKSHFEDYRVVSLPTCSGPRNEVLTTQLSGSDVLVCSVFMIAFYLVVDRESRVLKNEDKILQMIGDNLPPLTTDDFIEIEYRTGPLYSVDSVDFDNLKQGPDILEPDKEVEDIQMMTEGFDVIRMMTEGFYDLRMMTGDFVNVAVDILRQGPVILEPDKALDEKRWFHSWVVFERGIT